MGFDLLSYATFRFSHHVEFYKKQIDADSNFIKNQQEMIVDNVSNEWEFFTKMLPTEQRDDVKSAITNATIIPLMDQCLPINYSGGVDTDDVVVYPCGAGGCMKCSSLKPCIKNDDCQFLTRCSAENKCTMIASSAMRSGIGALIVGIGIMIGFGFLG